MVLAMETMLPTLLATTPDLGPVYIVMLIVGGGLLFISTVLGHDSDADIDTDIGDIDLDVPAGVDLDVDVDMDVDSDGLLDVGDHVDGAHVDAGDGALSLSSWFSLRFVVYFAAVAGSVGTVLTYMTKMSTVAVAIPAGLSGIVVGQIVHQLIRYLKKTSGGTHLTTEDFLNKPARVTVSIKPHGRGEVAVQVQNFEKFLPARAKREDDAFSVGDEVVVVEISGGTAGVVSRQEHEFLTDTK